MNKTKENIIKAVLYIRVSTEEQVRHGYSLDSQKNRLLEYCKEKGYQVIDIYVDEGKTARSKIKNRTELLRLIEDAKEKKFDRIVFWKLDRWFRNIADYYKVQEILENNKIDWECSDEEYNTTTSNGRLHLNIKLSIAQNESDQTGDRIRFNFDNMVKNGKAITGSHAVPLGFMVAGEERNKKVVKNPETEQIAIDMLDYIRKCGSIRETLFHINEKYNLNICYDSMRHYLRNTKYYGCYRGNENYCDSYITKQEFDEIQSLIKCNVKMNKVHDYIFSGLIKCPICHRNMAGFRSKNTRSHGKKVNFIYPSYRCNYAFNAKKCTNKKSIVENTLEKYLINNIQEEMKKYIINLEKIGDTTDKENVVIDKDKIKAKLNRLTDLYIDGKILREKYDLEFEKLNSQLNDTSVKVKQEKRDLNIYKEFIDSNLLDLYNKLNNKSKRMFWAKYIDFIEKIGDNEYKIYFKN